MIQLTSVSKYYPGGAPGLVDISVEIPDGEFVFLIGPSGSGKTTFLRLLIRDLLPSSGTILIDGTDLTKYTKSSVYQLRRKVGIVFQDFKLLMDRTVFENVAMVLEILGKPSSEIPEGVMNVLGLVGLSDKKNLFPIQLSAGEMQRAAIARAIVGGPKILIADEPTGNLDTVSGQELIETFVRLVGEGRTIIMVTHDLEYLKYATKIFHMVDGMVVEEYTSTDKIKKLKIEGKKAVNNQDIGEANVRDPEFLKKLHLQ